LVDDDPGMVDNIFLVLGYAPQQQPQPMNEDVIIASSDSEGAVEEEPQVAQEAVVPDVQVFIPMEDGIPLPFIPDEIQENELMDLDDLIEVNNQQGANALHVGLVRFIQPEADSVFVSRQLEIPQPRSDFFRRNSEAIRLWAKCFAPGPGASTVHVPAKWVDFFTLLLSSPIAFHWAKYFPNSSALPFLASVDSSSSIPFCLPCIAPNLGHQLCTKNLPDPICFEEPSLTPLGNSNLEPIPDSNDATHGEVSDKTLSPSKSLDIATPSTPLDQLTSKIVTSPGPWSSALLSLAAKGKAPKN
jgi:hypothetical protein